MLACLVPLVLLANGLRGAQEEAWPVVEFRSADGRFVAEIAKVAGQERVRDSLARWHLEVLALSPSGSRSALWSCAIAHGGEPRRHLLSNDGTTFVQLVDRFPSRRPLVRVLREGREVAALDQDGLGLELPRTHVEPGAWLAPEADAARLEWRVTDVGAWLALVLRGRGDATAAVDLGTGELVLSARLAGPPVVLPAPPRDPDLRLQSSYVSELEAPPFTLAGEPLELTLQGAYPTPNWNLMGFELARADPRLAEELGESVDRERTLEVVPRIAPPERGPQGAVLAGFRSTASVHGLSVGRWVFYGRGRDERPVGPVSVDVLPARLRVRLVVAGGSADERRLSLYVPGVLERSDGASPTARFAMLAERDLARIEALLDELPAEPRWHVSDAAGAALELGWWRDGRWRTLRADERTAEPAVLALVQALLPR